MEKQSLIFTALPNGFNADGVARLSVFIAPRLWSSEASAGYLSLDHYPDLLNWPARVSALTWEAQIDDGGPMLSLTVESDPSNPLKPELWAALFKDATRVNPFMFEDFRGLKIQTVPIWSIYDTIADVYGRASSDVGYGAGEDRPKLDVLASDVDLSAIARPSYPETEPTWYPPEMGSVPFPDAIPVTEKPEPPEPSKPKQKCWLWRLLCWLFTWLRSLFGLGPCPGSVDAEAPTSPEFPTAKVVATPSFKTDVTTPAAAPSPPSGKTFLPPPLTPAQQQTRLAFDALDAFLKPFDGLEPQLPSILDLAKTWDFHQALSSLGDYPALLRRLGLVIDLLLPAGTVLPAAGRIRVSSSGVAWMASTTIVSPRTHFVSAPSLFTAAPRPDTPEISNGFLRINDATRFRVIQNDVIGDAVKLRNAATHDLRFAMLVDRPPNMPGEAGLPALRTAGVSLIRRDTAEELAKQFIRSCALNLFLAQQDNSPEPESVNDAGDPPPPSEDLFAEDLVRGYRIDVYDAKSATWRSLCERNGEYRFLEAEGGPVVETASDEGFVQFAVTTSCDPAFQSTIRAAESLFTWNGWSLAAPRPGKSIMPGDNEDPNYPPNFAATPFKIETSFKAKSESLPRLRFGRAYRLRARVADLAGNSVAKPGDAAYSVDAPATAEFVAMRYEPVAPPILMLQAPPIEGESVERMVVRTPAISAVPSLVTLSARHIAPPKASQLLVELHGKFDAGSVDGSPAGYALAARESKSVKEGAQQTAPNDERGIWFQPAEHLEVLYLPDPQARGVAFKDLPGSSTSKVIPFEGSWPDLLPIRIDLKAVAASPGEPVWEQTKRVLTVELAPAQRATIRINSVLNPADLQSRGVWQWTADKAPINFVQVKQSLLEGKHWAHLPWREVTMLHAVQTPLQPPNIIAAVPQKTLGKTYADLTGGQISVDGPSTGRVQLLAKWIDQIDDPNLPAPAPRTQEAHICEVEVGEKTNFVDMIDSATKTNPKHELHDTKHHHVIYTPVAITRFREYFPEDSNTFDAISLRGGDFDVDVLNSVRPAAPKILYALPVFDWDSPPGTTGVKERTRGGGALRIYIDRPWYSSGDGELLGVIYCDGVDLLTLDDSLKPLVTQWGADPIWGGGPTPGSVQEAHFMDVDPNRKRSGLTLEEYNKPVFSVAGYEPIFDPDRRLWRADVKINAGDAYWPFVRLALARFQPKSVDGAHLSRIFRSDFIQLPPKRHTKIETSLPKIHVKVKGPVYTDSELIQNFRNNFHILGDAGGSNGLSEVEAVIERYDPSGDIENELAWNPIEGTRVTLFQDLSSPGTWEGDVTLIEPLASGRFRLKVKEFEWFRSDDKDVPRQVSLARRVVFADVFAIE